MLVSPVAVWILILGLCVSESMRFSNNLGCGLWSRRLVELSPENLALPLGPGPFS